jgi:membrane-associated protein
VSALKEFLDYFLNLDDKLRDLIGVYGVAIYLILFLIIFVETGLVVMPFLPGDSLLFAAGSFAAMGMLNLGYLLGLLFVAAVLGDTVNYLIGKYVGLKVLHWKIGKRQLVKQKHIDETHMFFEKHGPKTIIIARFVPIVRTFAPFVAGIAEMNYRKFISYNFVGGFVWIISLTLLGYWFGNTEFVKNNFETVIFGIIFISVLPIIISLIKNRGNKPANTEGQV